MKHLIQKLCRWWSWLRLPKKNLVMWFEADDYSHGTLDGKPVMFLPDKSGNENHLVAHLENAPSIIRLTSGTEGVRTTYTPDSIITELVTFDRAQTDSEREEMMGKLGVAANVLRKFKSSHAKEGANED